MTSGVGAAEGLGLASPGSASPSPPRLPAEQGHDGTGIHAGVGGFDLTEWSTPHWYLGVDALRGISSFCSAWCLCGLTKPAESVAGTALELLGAQMRNALNNLTDSVTDETPLAAPELLGVAAAAEAGKGKQQTGSGKKHPSTSSQKRTTSV